MAAAEEVLDSRKIDAGERKEVRSDATASSSSTLPSSGLPFSASRNADEWAHANCFLQAPPQLLDDALTALARRRSSTRSKLVREAVEVLAKGKRRSVTAVVDELVGSLQGLKDLSTNATHMRGYGR